jgi:hypothetical protein
MVTAEVKSATGDLTNGGMVFWNSHAKSQPPGRQRCMFDPGERSHDTEFDRQEICLHKPGDGRHIIGLHARRNQPSVCLCAEIFKGFDERRDILDLGRIGTELEIGYREAENLFIPRKQSYLAPLWRCHGEIVVLRLKDIHRHKK